MRWLLIAEESEHTSCLESALQEEAVQISIGRPPGRVPGDGELSRMVEVLKRGGEYEGVLLCLEPGDVETELLPALRQVCELPLAVAGSSLENTYYEELWCLEQGADDYFSLSMPVPIMLVRMQRLIQLYRGRTEAVRYWRGLEESVEAEDYLWQGKPLELTRTEYQVLSLLLHGRGEIVTREKLLARIWQREGEQESCVLPAMIRKLRKKLSPTPLRIVSCYGKGYRLEQE